MNRVRIEGRAALVGLWVLIAPWSVLAQAPSAPASADIGSTRESYTDARARLEHLRAEQSSLERRIATLKKSGTDRQALVALLERSVDAEATLDAARREVDRAETAYTKALTTAITTIDVNIRARVPDLKRGPLEARRAAAAQINVMRTARQGLRAELAALARARQRTRAWAQYQVQYDEDDGPVELTEKADFVEDTRDKVVRKRRAIIQLIEEARQHRRIAEAAQDFRTDVTLFDEETRQGRVRRQTRTGIVPLSSGGNRSPPETDAPAFGDGPESDPGSDSAGGDPVVSSPAVTAPPPTVSGLRALNPDVLLNLRVEDVAAGALDVATLNQYVEDLKALEAFLSGQADSLRRRANALKADEARKLQE